MALYRVHLLQHTRIDDYSIIIVSSGNRVPHGGSLIRFNVLILHEMAPWIVVVESIHVYAWHFDNFFLIVSRLGPLPQHVVALAGGGDEVVLLVVVD